MSNFWNKYEALCALRNESPTRVAKDIGVSSSALTKWRTGRIPSGETLLVVADYFNVSVEYLLKDDEINIRPAEKKRVFASLSSLPQRWASLRHGDAISDNDISRIAAFTNCTISFLYSDDQKEYVPADKDKAANVNDLYILDMILGIMDRCPDTGNLRRVQIQLSHIVRYWLAQKGIGFDELSGSDYKAISKDKLKFLYDKDTHVFDQTFRYGLNFTELDAIRETSGLTFLYLFTGIEGDIGEILCAEKDRKIAELEARIAELENKD